MHCNGKCYLAKQLAKIENDYQKKQHQPAPFQIKNAEWIFIQSVTPKASSIRFNIETKNPAYFVYLELQSNHISKIPTPPPNSV